MEEFMLFIRPDGERLDDLSAEDLQKHSKKFAGYIASLVKEGKLKSAQPLESGGKVVSGKKGLIKDGPFNETKEIIAGYFHIVAQDLDEAVQIARANPMFQDGEGKIEIRQIKRLEGINQ